MSGDGVDWTALASEYERLAGDVARPGPASAAASQPAQWAELASQRERLLEAATAPELASSERGTAAFRLVVHAA
ncbi:MAG TPA: hypothetical protein VEL03_18705 [Streptosporangiaceae bacterium]|nr:hypothetical protein [Streptosporangiaceae bacterium]